MKMIPTRPRTKLCSTRNNRVAIAQAQLDALLAGNPDAVNASQANVSAAVAQQAATEADYQLFLLGATEAEIAAAEANIAQAEANLAGLLEPASNEELAQAEALLAQRQLDLQAAQDALDAATITAPFAGTVTQLYVVEGELASGIVVELVDMDSLEVVVAVDEIDVAQLAVGQPAGIILEAYPDTTIDAAISRIAPSAATNSDLVTYDVYLELATTDLPLRVGLTANADLITAQRTDVLLVPNRAITADRQTGRYYVNLVTSTSETTTTETIEVTIGLRDNQSTQILDGLQPGDQLLIGSNLPVQTFDGPGQ